MILAPRPKRTAYPRIRRVTDDPGAAAGESGPGGEPRALIPCPVAQAEASARARASSSTTMRLSRMSTRETSLGPAESARFW